MPPQFLLEIILEISRKAPSSNVKALKWSWTLWENWWTHIVLLQLFLHRTFSKLILRIHFLNQVTRCINVILGSLTNKLTQMKNWMGKRFIVVVLCIRRSYRLLHYLKIESKKECDARLIKTKGKKIEVQPKDCH